MREPIQGRSCQPFAAQHFGPVLTRSVILPPSVPLYIGWGMLGYARLTSVVFRVVPDRQPLRTCRRFALVTRDPSACDRCAQARYGHVHLGRREL
jgi:hypothetical protein